MSIGGGAARRWGHSIRLSCGIAGALCGCGTAPPAEVDPGSIPEVEYFGGGTRLLPRVAGAAGDVSYLVGWYDTLLETACDFSPAADGVWRCLPLQLGGVTRGDPQCQQAYASLPLGSCTYGAQAFEKVRWFLDSSWSCRRRIFRRAADAEPLLEARPGYGLSFEGSCSPDVESTIEPGSFPVTQVDPAEFVAAHLQPSDEERAPGMKAWLRTADDGAWEIRGFFDVEHDIPCSIESVSPDELDQCLPAPRRAFEDTTKVGPSCELDAVIESDCAEEPVRAVSYGSPRNGDACSPPDIFYLADVKAPVRADFCAPGADRPDSYARSSSAYVVGYPLRSMQWPQLERLYVGRGRLKLRFLGSGGVPFLPDSPERTLGNLGLPSRRDAIGFWDSQFDEPCTAHWIDDDHAVCLSASWLTADDPLFADYATCLSDPLTQVVRRPRCGDAPPPGSLRGLFVPGPASGACWFEPPSSSAYQLHTAEPFTGDRIYRDGGPFLVEPIVCSETQRQPQLDYFLPGESLAAGLVAGIEVHEPGP